jgi:hypothetical protein
VAALKNLSSQTFGNRKMKYEDLSHNDFDAIVTGELTHYALNLEGELIAIITDYFIGSDKKRADFKRLFLFRNHSGTSIN